MGGMSDDDPDNPIEDEEMEVEAGSGKSKKEREADLKAMMDMDDEPMEDVEEDTNQDAIDTPKARQLLTQPGTTVLDVRTPVEFLAGHLPQARNLNVNSDGFAQQIAQLDTSKTYVVYCHSGKRSGKAIGLMRQQGFHRLVNGGGYDALK